MPDVFDQLEASTPSTSRGLLASAQRGVKNLLGLPDTLAAAGVAGLDKPTIAQERKAFVRAMSDPRYQEALVRAEEPRQLLRIESTLGPAAQLERAMTVPRALQRETAADAAAVQRDIEALPKSEAQQRLAAATDTSGKWAAWRKDPIELTTSIVLESLPTSLAGALVGGVGGSVAVGVGSASALQTFSGEFLSNAGALGYDVSDPDSLQQFLANEEDFQKAFKPAAVKATVVGGVDATTAGLAGRFIEPALKEGLKRVAVAGGKELGMQAAGGSGGELVGSLAAGQKPDLFDVAMEGIAEIATGPGEVIGNLNQARRGAPPQANAATPQTPKPIPQTPAPTETIQDLTAAVKDLQATLRGEVPASERLKPVERRASSVEGSAPSAQTQTPVTDELLQRALDDLPADARAEIEARLVEGRESRDEGLEAATTRLEQWIVQQSEQYKGVPGGLDSQLKRVSEDIRAGKLPEDLREVAMRQLRPTRDAETGETLDWSNDDFPRTATLINFLESRAQDRIPDVEQRLQTERLQAGAESATTAPDAAIGTVTGQNEGKASDATAGDIAAEQMPAEVRAARAIEAEAPESPSASGGQREQAAPTAPENRVRQMTFEAATNPDRYTLSEFWDALKRGLRYLASPIPELPLTGETARRSALFRRGYRLFTAETTRVQHEAAAKVKRVLEPLEKLRSRAQNDALKRYFELGTRLERARQAMDDRRIATLSQQLADLEQTVNRDPFNLFRKLVLYRDLWWRGTYLKTEQGKPITLPNGLSIDEVAAELRALTQQLDAHPDKAAIAEALKRHYALTDELQKSILAHGEIIPEALRNPLYFPHHLLDYWTGRIDRVRPSTEEDFRRYLIAPVGSGKLVQADYLKAMYVHTADVLAHNARTDLVKKYWQSYDISEELKRQHGEAWDKPWNLPPGYKLFAPFKKLPLRMDYILTREVLADQLGVLFNDGDLRARLGEAGQVLKVKPEDLHAAMVAGEKIKWALPVEIADALEGISKREKAASNPGLGHTLGAPFRGLNTFWKRVKLFAPWNWIRYEYGNLTTDIVDKVMVADPKVATYLKQAAGEILRASRQGEKSEAFKAASREGVFETITASEAGELQRLREFAEFAGTRETAQNVVHNFLAATTKASHFREATFRYAKFLADVDRMNRGERPVYAGAYHEDIEALGDTAQGQQQMLQGDELTYAKAAEISLKTFGDYNSLGVISQWLRTYAIPFWSWQDVNFRYHANALRNIADGLRGIRGGTPRDVALKYAAARVVLTLTAVGIAQQLWNTFGGPMLGLWDDDEDLESQLSAADRRRSHVLLGKDRDGQVLVVYTPSAFADVAEWVGGLNMKRLFVEWAQGDITLEQFVSDYAKQAGPDVLNKFAQSAGPLVKAPYETISGQAVFPDVLDQRRIPAADRWWRLAGTMTDDRAVNWLRQVFDQDYYSAPANQQLQHIILQVRRRDPEQWAYYEARERAADWKEAKTGKRFEAGSYDAPEAQVLRNFRRAIYRADVAAAEQFYGRLLEYGYTAERLNASIRAQHPLADLSKEQRAEYLPTLDARARRELSLAEAYYSRIGALDRRERRLFPTERRKKYGSPFPLNKELLREVMER